MVAPWGFRFLYHWLFHVLCLIVLAFKFLSKVNIICERKNIHKLESYNICSDDDDDDEETLMMKLSHKP